MASYLKNNDVLYDSARKKLWIDTSEQDELLWEFLGIERWSTFSSLNVLADKYDKNWWLESAVRIWRSKYNKLDELWADGEFRNAFEYYKEVTENAGENFKISTKDVDDEWNWIREKTNNSWESEWWTSTNTSQSE